MISQKMKLRMMLGLTALLLVLLPDRTFANDPIFAARPFWSSGSSKSGGDGIARFIDFDGDGDLDFVTCAPNPKRWVLFRNEAGKLAAEGRGSRHEFRSDQPRPALRLFTLQERSAVLS